MGAKIGRGSKICFGSLVAVPSKKLNIGKNVLVNTGNYIRCQDMKLDDNVKISSCVKINLKEFSMGKYACINSFTILVGSKITIGDHSKIFEFCFLEAGKPITIGKRVGIGGHGLIFTHGSWSNYLEGGPVAFGEVTIEDNVWLPWRVFILPNVTIGENSIIGGNSLVNKSIPRNSLAAGAPAKIIKENFMQTSVELRQSRLREIIDVYKDDFKQTANIFLNEPDLAQSGDIVFYIDSVVNDEQIKTLLNKGINVINYDHESFHISSNQECMKSFVDFLTIYGIRLYEK